MTVSIHPQGEIWRYTNYMNLQFEPAEKVVMKDQNWCQTLGIYAGVHCPDLIANSYDINNMKFDLNAFF